MATQTLDRPLVTSVNRGPRRAAEWARRAPLLPALVFTITITSGGLGTANLPYTIYQTFFQAHDYGQASAAGVIVVIASIVIATFALRVVSSLLRNEVTR